MKIALFIIGTFILTLTPTKIPTKSMSPTIKAGDYIMFSKLSYGLYLPFINNNHLFTRKPKRGDIVAFKYKNVDYVKRVVAIEYDTIEIKYNKIITQDKIYPYKTKYNYKKIKLKKNEFFLLGDNADNSIDSRTFGPIPYKDIHSKYLFKYWNSL
jgi:signal peptidase I